MSLNTNDPEKVGKFVDELCVALTKDMTEIRETELDRSGSYRKATAVFTNPSGGSCPILPMDLFVDRLGRVITPAEGTWDSLVSVYFEGETLPRKVVKTEKRYEGDKIVAYVIYLEAKEGEPHA